MLLSSLYEEKEEPAKRVCRPGFKRPLLKKKSKKQLSQTAVVTESLGYAADMNYMLAFIITIWITGLMSIAFCFIKYGSPDAEKL